MAITKELIMAYALKNALMHEGKCAAGSVISSLFNEGLKKEEAGGITKEVNEIVAQVNSMAPEKQEEEYEKYRHLVSERHVREGLQELPNAAMGKVVVRVAPFPSGALHIGNAKTYLLNALYAEKYKGKIFLFMDDTIGSEEKQILAEAYRLVEEGFRWLGVKYETPVYYKSDRLEIYYRYAEELVKKGNAYVCHCNVETLRKNRENRIECGCRQFPAEEQLKRWKDMFHQREGEAALRIKTDMNHPNPAFRDRVLFRISEREHPRTGKKYRVWPMLEFSWAIDDHLLGITHVIRGNELMIESEMEKFIWDIFGWKYPELIHVGLIRLTGIGAKISKSKAQAEVKSGKFFGWDDPRTWSLQSLEKRGILPEAIRKFVIDIGLNKSDIEVPIEKLYAFNKEFIDKNAKRLFLVKNPARINVKGNEKVEITAIKLYPDEREDSRELAVRENIYVDGNDFARFRGREVRLKGLCNIKLDEKTESIMQENPKVQKIQWVADGVPVRVLMPDGEWIKGIGEKYIEELKDGEIIQFERFGFCKLDRKGKEGYEFWFGHN